MTRMYTKGKQKITLGVPPSTNSMYRSAINRDTGKIGVFLVKEVRQWRDTHHHMLCFLKPIPQPTEVRVDIVWHLTPDTSGDLDNRLKVLLDALQGHGYENDSQVAELIVSRIRNQRQALIHVTVSEITDHILRDDYTTDGGDHE